MFLVVLSLLFYRVYLFYSISEPKALLSTFASTLSDINNKFIYYLYYSGMRVYKQNWPSILFMKNS